MHTLKPHEGDIAIKLWIDPTEVEASAMTQLHNTATMPFIFKHIAVMPDVHAGVGATVGSVIPTKGAVIPAAVGVDIGCGMCAVPTNLSAHHLPDSLKKIRFDLEDVVPVGFGCHEEEALHLTPDELSAMNMSSEIKALLDQYDIQSGKQNPFQQLGTLGGGNHFIELCLDETHRLWIMLHSGSRGIGNRIGTRFIELARTEIEFKGEALQDPDLAYLLEDTPVFRDYLKAVLWAQQYAATNRRVMLRRIVDSLSKNLPELKVDLDNRVVQCHHNYISQEVHFGENIYVTRKGAVRAGKGELGIIPGSMGAKSYIVEGLGNDDAFHSCSHGAGRRMSRGKAKRTFSVKDHEQATHGIECRKDEGVIDETPMAYKDIDEVMASQTSLVRPLHTLRQIVCIKG
jgi:tRNA-splicing ligase RtcB